MSLSEKYKKDLIQLLRQIKDIDFDLHISGLEGVSSKALINFAEILGKNESSNQASEDSSKESRHGKPNRRTVDKNIQDKNIPEKKYNPSNSSRKFPPRKNITYKYQVALSFAGEDREYAKKLYELLKDKNITVFYDENEQHKLWGKNLEKELQLIYQEKSRYCLVLVSKHYSQKDWTMAELEFILQRSFPNVDHILPLRIDDTKIPGIKKTIGYIDTRRHTMEKVADLIEEKLKIVR